MQEPQLSTEDITEQQQQQQQQNNNNSSIATSATPPQQHDSKATDTEAVKTAERVLLRALFDFTSDDPRELNFKAGDIIEVVKQSESGWWDGILLTEFSPEPISDNNNNDENAQTGGTNKPEHKAKPRGLFPHNYTETVVSLRDGTLLTSKGSVIVPRQFRGQTCIKDEFVELLSKIKIKEGYMVKRGHVVKNWKERWFVLRHDELLYYHDENEPRSSGSIPICAETKIDFADEMRPHCFCIVTGKKELYVSANDEKTLREWMDLIKLVIQRHKDPKADIRTLLR